MEAVSSPGDSGFRVCIHELGTSCGNVGGWRWPSRRGALSFRRCSRVGRNALPPCLSWTASRCTRNAHCSASGPPNNITHEESRRPNFMSPVNADVLENVRLDSGDLDEGYDVLLLSNGPGEVATWVKRVVTALRACCSRKVNYFRISVVLAPCPHASGAELELLRAFKEVDRCQGPESFWKFLFLGSTKDGWTWHKRGVCIFLGGDQAYALLLGLRLGYKVIIYAEDAVRWPGIAHKYMLRSEELMRQVPNWAKPSCAVVGDLFSDAVLNSQNSQGCEDSEFSHSAESSAQSFSNFRPELTLNEEERSVPVVGLLPGSKESKLALGVPYFMAVAEHLHYRMNGRIRFVLPLAPTATVDMLKFHADIDSNPFILQLGWASGSVTQNPRVKAGCLDLRIKKDGSREPLSGAIAYLETSGGVQIEIWHEFPAHSVFKLCSLCLTTIGTNTAELGLLGIPMLVVLPTHALEVFKGGTGGLLGLLAKQPGWVGRSIAHAVNLAILKAAGYLAWPNRWTGEEVVPEFVGKIEPNEVAAIAAYYLTCEKNLLKMRQQLFNVCEKHFWKRSEVSGLLDVTSSSAGGAAAAVAAEVARIAVL